MALIQFQHIQPDRQRLIDGEEEVNVEFKESDDAITADYFVAFANAHGGTIIAGVKDRKDPDGRRTIVGCHVSDGSRQSLINKARSCVPAIDILVTEENLADKPIYRIDVAEGKNKPYCTKSGVYKLRVGNTTQAAEPDHLQAIFLQRAEDEFIARFRHAAEQVITKIEDAQLELEATIEQVAEIARKASYVAEAAEEAAQSALDAAEGARSGTEWLVEHVHRIEERLIDIQLGKP